MNLKFKNPDTLKQNTREEALNKKIENSFFSAEEMYALYENCPYEIEVRDTVTSTNTILKDMAKEGKAENFVLIAKEQTEGRGRLGRRFESPDKTGLYMSVLIRPEMKAEESLYITTSAGVAVSRAIKKLSGGKSNPKIKWVNDIFVNDLKVCGILTEASVNYGNGCLEYAVLGIGVNIYSSEHLKKTLSGIAGGAFDSSVENLPNRLACEILKELEFCLDVKNRKEILAEYKKLSYLDGKRVNVISSKETYPATVVEIDDSFGLVVKTDDGEIKTISSGEVSVRAK